MYKNTEEKEPDVFEEELEYRITNHKMAISKSVGGAYTEGQKSGFEYALAIYRQCKKDGTI
jgi:hypothetical protein